MFNFAVGFLAGFPIGAVVGIVLFNLILTSIEGKK